MKRYALRAGEALAIDPSVVRHDEAGFFIVLGGDPPANEPHGSVCVVHIRGALMHFDGEGGDSYEAILQRVKAGLATEPTAIVFRIESPGGVVAGLNESVFKLQRMSQESGVPFYAFVDEMAASAAYAMCCACEEIFAPPSAIIGSIGCISTMVSQSAADKQMGLDFRLIVSGKRKADGHPHAPIDPDAVKAETARNTELAAQFFDLAGKARGVAPAKLQSLQAAIYLGKEAKRVGLIDDVWTFDELIAGLDQTETPPPETVAPNAGNVTDRRAKESPLDKPNESGSHSTVPRTNNDSPSAHGAVPMSVKLDALIKRTEAAISTETDPKKIRALQAQLAAFSATKAEMDDGDDEPDKKKKGDEDDDGDSEAAKHAENARKMKAKAKAMGHRAKAAEHKQKAAESEEEAKKCEEEASGADEDDEEAKAMLDAATRAALGTHPAAVSAAPGADPTVVALVRAVADLTAQTTKIRADG